jgi:tetratricopeptide (TPR) repeat protein
VHHVRLSKRKYCQVTPKTIVCDTDHVIAIDQDFGGDSVVVTFNEAGFVRNELRFWGDDFFLKQRISAFGIVTPRPNWYPRRAMDEVIAAVREKINGRNVVTCGHGQGGYGALKFSARLKASIALSFCPQWSINPADVSPFDSRFGRYFSESLSNGLRIEQEDLCSCALIVFDRMQEMDSTHAEKLAALDGVKTIVAPFAAYETARLPREGGSVGRLISLCRSGRPPEARDLRRVIRASRNDSTTYLNALLRELILRLSRSRSRSTVFVAALLEKTNNNENSFYSALVSHARGDTRVAQAQLTKAQAKAINTPDLLDLWRLATKLRFIEAELALAVQICERQPANTRAGLSAVNTLIRVGNVEDAYRELMRLTKHEHAAHYIDKFVEYSLQLRRPEVLEAFLPDSLPRPTKNTVLFGLVDCYRGRGDRASAFRTLMDLAQTCIGSREDLLRVAAWFVKIGECSMALDIRRRLLQSSPGDHWLALDIVDVKVRLLNEKKGAHSEYKRIRSELTEIMKAPDLPATAWERASHLYESLGDKDAALRAIRRAAKGLESTFKMRYRLIVLLRRKRRRRSARRELEALFVKCRKDSRRLRMLGKLALWVGDRQLAQEAAEAQLECEPPNPEGILYVARQLRIVGDRIRAQSLLSNLFHAEQRSPFISEQQWVGLAQELYRNGDITLAKEAIAKIAGRLPNDQVVRTLATRIALTEKQGERVSRAAPRKTVSELVPPGFLSRLVRIFRK